MAVEVVGIGRVHGVIDGLWDFWAWRELIEAHGPCNVREGNRIVRLHAWTSLHR